MKKLTIFFFLFLSTWTFIHSQSKDDKRPFTESFMLDSCTMQSTGRNTYFILEPGYQLKLQGIDEGDTVRLIITVLNETKMIGNTETRIVEENESVNGKQVEISRNYFAFCKDTKNIFYYGEDVDIYKEGKVVKSSDGWIVYDPSESKTRGAENKNKPGLIMPGTYLLGSRYYQEIAPNVAMDRAEIISISETLKTPAGTFINCLKTEETTPLEPKEKEYKIYAPGIGLIKDENLLLVEYGFVK